MSDGEPKTVEVGADGRTYDQYVAVRDKLADAELEISKAYEKHLLTLSSGALGLSLLFVEKIAPTPRLTILLSAAWLALAACALACVLGIVLSLRSLGRMAQINEDAFEEGPAELDESNEYADRVQQLNWAALVLFVSGVTLLVFFAIVNQRGTLL